MKTFFTGLSPILPFALMIGCGGSKSGVNSSINSAPKAPNIDLTHWKVTIPTLKGDNSGETH